VLIQIANRVLSEYTSDDLTDTVHRISALVRRDISKALSPFCPLLGGLPVFDSLADIFGEAVIRDDSMGWLGRDSLQGKIMQHFIQNDDWSNEELLINCGATTCSQRRFFALIEKLVHPLTRSDDEQMSLAETVSLTLKRDGYTVKQIGSESGYAIYGVARVQSGVTGAMKNLIFASIGENPSSYFGMQSTMM
jgi:hypothetical protein